VSVEPVAARSSRLPIARLLAVLAAVAVTAGVLAVGLRNAGSSNGGAPAPSTLTGHPAPALSGRTLDGRRLDLAALRGSVVLVNIWASWCAPCREEIPLLVQAEKQLGPRGLRVVGVATRDGPVAARALLSELGGGPASLVDPDGSIAVEWGATGVPETFLVDQQGIVRGRCWGEVTQQWLRDNVEPLLPA
jgi:cytochrome c biogenesis protein CcmG/thiol:disulfide interchange protein DsbE